jgi:hypothetical protein
MLTTTASRWHLSDMQHERGLPAPNEEAAREQCLRSGPNLATVRDFIRFYIATSRPRLAEQPTVDSINTVAEWFFAGFTRVTGTETDAEERSEVYNVSSCFCPILLSIGRNLIGIVGAESPCGGPRRE